MTTSLLDMDVTAFGRGLEQTWRWWTGQLRAMTPPWARVARGGRERVAQALPDGGFAVSRRGRRVTAAEAAGRGALVSLDPASCLMRQIALPVLSEADARRAVMLDLDRLLPFPSGQALVEIALGPTSPGGRMVTLAALPIGAAERLLADAEHAAIQPTALAVLDENGVIRFDFLPSLRARRGQRDLHADRRFWWRAVLAGFMLNLVLLVLADLRSLQHFSALVETHAALADRVRLERRRISNEQAWREVVAERRQQGNPLPLLADVIGSLPASVTIRRIEINGDRARLVGVAPLGFDVSAALRRNSRLAAIRTTSVDPLARTPEGQPFDIAAVRAQ